MFFAIIVNFFISLLGGFVLEFIYRSVNAKKLVMPKFVNYQMYGLTGSFLVLVYFLNISLLAKLLLIFIFPTLVEFITGYLYLKTKGVYLWDYSKERFNFMNLICLRFSLIWFVISLLYYYCIIPLFN